MKIPTYSYILVLVTMEILPANMLLHPEIIQQPGEDVDIVTETSLPHVDQQLIDYFTINHHHFYQRTDLIAKTFILNCTAVGNPKPSYVWTKDTVILNLTSLGDRVRQISGQGSLEFLRPRAEDAGKYQCFAENEHGTAASDTVFVRTVRSSTMQYRNTSVKAVMSGSVELRCGYSGSIDWPKPRFNWTTTNGKIPENKTSIDPNGNLWFSKTIASDSKTYTCVAWTYYQSIPVRSVKLSFEENDRSLEFPEPLYISQSTDVISGQSVNLYCILNYTADYNMTWRTSLGPIQANSSRLSTDVTGQILRIHPVLVSDHNNYTCRISFDGTYMEFGPILLSVFEKPKFKVAPKCINKLKGETAKIRCETTGVPKPYVAWYFNGQLIPDNYTHPRCHNGGIYLMIEGLTSHESGNFACNASNEAGYVFKDVFLHVGIEKDTNRTSTIIVSTIAVSFIIITIITAYLWMRKSRKTERDSDSISVETAFINDPEDPLQFPRHHLLLLDVIGAGNFGRVFLAEAKFEENDDGGTRQKVAVKTTQVNAPAYAHEDLLHELCIMKRLGNHHNVVQLLGACTKRSPIFLIMELLSESLHQFLRKAQAQKYYDLPVGASLRITSQKLIDFAVQVARGMQHVSSHGIIHRDLATRNVLLSSDLVCKIADFGLAREVNTEQIYVRQTNVPLPIRWMSPESILAEEMSMQSDVWSFGVLLWELTTLGATPYPGKRVDEVKLMVRNSVVMEKPNTCDLELYNIMRKCWHTDAEQRPDFQHCVDLLSTLKNGDYIRLDDFPEHEYYNIVKGEGEIV